MGLRVSSHLCHLQLHSHICVPPPSLENPLNPLDSLLSPPPPFFNGPPKIFEEEERGVIYPKGFEVQVILRKSGRLPPQHHDRVRIMAVIFGNSNLSY